jgi:hypothetical protein
MRRGSGRAMMWPAKDEALGCRARGVGGAHRMSAGAGRRGVDQASQIEKRAAKAGELWPHQTMSGRVPCWT